MEVNWKKKIKKAISLTLSLAMVVSVCNIMPKQVVKGVDYVDPTGYQCYGFADPLQFYKVTQRLSDVKYVVSGNSLTVSWTPAKIALAYFKEVPDPGESWDGFREGLVPTGYTTMQSCLVAAYQWQGSSLVYKTRKKVKNTNSCTLSNLTPGAAYHIIVDGRHDLTKEDTIINKQEFDVIIPYNNTISAKDVSVEYNKSGNKFQGFVKIKVADKNKSRTYLSQQVDYNTQTRKIKSTKGSLSQKVTGYYGSADATNNALFKVNVSDSKTFTIANIRPITELKYTAVSPGEGYNDWNSFDFWLWENPTSKYNKTEFNITKRSQPLASYGSGISVYVPHPIKAKGKGQLKIKVPTSSIYEYFIGEVFKTSGKKISSLKINKKSKFTIQDGKKAKAYKNKSFVIKKDTVNRTVAIFPIMKAQYIKAMNKQMKTQYKLVDVIKKTYQFSQTY